jgi:hypothetical protein
VDRSQRKWRGVPVRPAAVGRSARALT